MAKTRSKSKSSKGVESYVKGKTYNPGTKVQYKNGTVAQIQKDGRHKFVKGYSLTEEQKAKRRKNLAKSKGPGSKKMSPRAAVMAFNKYYAAREYKTDAARKAAMTRNLCNKGKVVVNNRRFLRSPGTKSFKGVTDGSKCPPGHKKTKYVKRKASPNQLAALAKGRSMNSKISGSPKRRRSPRKHRGGSGVDAELTGGNGVDAELTGGEQNQSRNRRQENQSQSQSRNRRLRGGAEFGDHCDDEEDCEGGYYCSSGNTCEPY